MDTNTVTVTTATGDKIHPGRGTATVKFPRGWWDNFMAEPVVEDALGYLPDSGDIDHTLEVTQRIVVDGRSARRTKSYVALELDLVELDTMVGHADWYTYYWGESMRSECDDWCDAGIWALRGRSSRALHRRLLKVVAELELALGI